MTSIDFSAGASQQLYNRAYSVVLSAPDGSGARQFGTEGSNPTQLRVGFEIERNLLGTPNKASVSIFNLSLPSRQSLVAGTMVRVRCGYAGLIETLFVGFAQKIGSERQGPDIVTTLECGDGEPYLTYSTIDKTYATPVTLAQLLSDIAEAMQVTINANVIRVEAGIAVGLPNKVFSRGYVLHGSCKHNLNQLLKPLGLEWSVQNNRLTIIPVKYHNGAQAQVVSSQTGMIGVPSTTGGSMQFVSLLNPRLVPGALVQLQTKDLSLAGFYKIRQSKYHGDTHDNIWQTEAECVPMTGSVQILPAANGFDFTAAVGL